MEGGEHRYSRIDKCIYCGSYLAEAQGHVCSTCEQRLTPNGAKTTANILLQNRSNIVKAARTRPTKNIDMEMVIKLAEIELSGKILAMQNPGPHQAGKQNELLKAIAETEVVLEILKTNHTANTAGREAYAFHLEQAARRPAEKRHSDDYTPIDVLKKSEVLENAVTN